MTYGIQLRNEEGDDLVDVTTGLTYYKKTSGTTKVANTTEIPLHNVTIPLVGSFRYRYFGPASMEWFPYNGIDQGYEHYLAGYISDADIYFNMNYVEGFDWVWRWKSDSVEERRRHYFPKTVSDNPDDMIFFKLPTEGIIGMGHYWFPFTGVDEDGTAPPDGLSAWLLPEPSAYNGTDTFNYQVVSTDVPVATSGDYGIQIFDDDGTTLMFDTRKEIASFSDHIFISKTDVQDIIENDTVRNFTLRQSTPNAWVSAEGSSLAAYRYDRKASTSHTDTFDTLLIKQTSNTNIKVSRNRLSDTGIGSTGTEYLVENYDDVLFIVADFN